MYICTCGGLNPCRNICSNIKCYVTTMITVIVTNSDNSKCRIKGTDIVMYKNQELLNREYPRRILEELYFIDIYYITHMHNICIYIYTYKKNDRVDISGQNVAVISHHLLNIF